MTQCSAAPAGGCGPRVARPALTRRIVAGARARTIGSKLRLRGAQARDETQAAVRRIIGELVGPAEKAMGEAEKLLITARRVLRRADARATQPAAVGDPAAALAPSMPPAARARPGSTTSYPSSACAL